MKPTLRTLAALLSGAVASASMAQTFYGLTTDNYLVSFDKSNPTALTSKVAINGLAQANELIIGIDFRPATGELYALGSSSRLYKLDTTTGTGTAVGGVFSTQLNGIEFGFDFNPTVDRVRITSDNEQNLRVHPVTGAIAAVDTALAYAAGDPNAGANPNIAGSAYTNNFAGATTTTLYNIDSNLNTLVTQLPPNAGTLNTVGSLGYNVSSLVGFDILGANDAYAALTLDGDFRSGLYSINLATGQATQLGAIGGTALQVRDIAVVPEPASMVALFGALGAMVARRRKA